MDVFLSSRVEQLFMKLLSSWLNNIDTYIHVKWISQMLTMYKDFSSEILMKVTDLFFYFFDYKEVIWHISLSCLLKQLGIFRMQQYLYLVKQLYFFEKVKPVSYCVVFQANAFITLAMLGINCLRFISPIIL